MGAAAADPLGSFDRTVRSTALLIDHLRRTAPDVRVVYPSSAAIYGLNDGGPLEEEGAQNPVSTYGWQKQMAESLLREAADIHGIACTAIRFFSVYGPGLRKQVLWDWSRRLLVGEAPMRLSGTGSEVRDFLYIDDAVRLMLQMAALKRPGFTAINGGTGCGTTMADLADRLTSALGYRVDAVFDQVGRVGDPPSYLASVRRLEAIGFAPSLSLAEGLSRYAVWVRAAAAEWNFGLRGPRRGGVAS